MADVLIVHDDSVVSRVAWLLEQRVAKIKLCESILNGGDKTPENWSASTACVKAQLDAERWALQELLEDIEEGLLASELKEIEKTYAREPEKSGVKRWIKDGNGVIYCPVCGEDHEWLDYRANYCESCGTELLPEEGYGEEDEDDA